MATLQDITRRWPGTWAAVAVGTAEDIVAGDGDLDRHVRVASITKLFTAYAALIALEEGTIELDEPAGPPGSTVRHLLAHASGLAFDEDRAIAGVGERRIYSNVGIEALARHLGDRAAMPFADYLRLGVLEPLGLSDMRLDGSPAHGLHASVTELMTFGRELLEPTLVDPATLAAATTPVWPDLRGVLPGFGRHDPNPWGLGFEIRGGKQPHWTSARHSPTTFGHFGGTGSFLWVDPVRRLVGASLCDTAFGEWAVELWPEVNDLLLTVAEADS